VLIRQVPSFFSSLSKELYNPKAFFTHAALLRQGFPHCAKFLTAASRRSLVRVPVPVWLIILSDQLPIVALVGHYPTNKLMGLGLLFLRLTAFPTITAVYVGVRGISQPFGWLSPSERYIIQVLLTRAPLY